MITTKRYIRKRKSSSVLRYSKGVSQTTVKRHYAKWRKENNLPDRCDNQECRFFTEPLKWNNQPLPLILDHINGVRADNSPNNLRYLCPNCNSQLLTHGGKNKGRVTSSEGGYSIKRKDGKRDYVDILDPGHFTIHDLMLGLSKY